jgi:hypothetical protein
MHVSSYLYTRAYLLPVFIVLARYSPIARGNSRKTKGNFITINIRFSAVGNGKLGSVGVVLYFLKR